MSIRQRNAHFTDWAAVCKALHVNTESEARAALESSDNTFYYYVCYIKSTKEIYTHGQIYSCSGNDDLLDLINELTTEVVENEEVTARALTELSENKASRGEVEMFELSKQDKIDDLDSIRTKANNAVQPDQISNFVSANDLAKVATSGSYNDLIDKPNIPNEITESTVSDWGFTKNNGTISGITIYGQEVGTSGVVELKSGLQPLLSSYIDSRELETALGKKQDTLISGKNICTVDGKSLLTGSDIPFRFVPRSSITTTSSKRYYLGANTKFNFSLIGQGAGFVLDCGTMKENKDNTWLMSFKTGDTAPTISISVSNNQYSLKWANNIAPVFEPNTCYELTFKLIEDCICGVCGVFY